MTSFTTRRAFLASLGAALAAPAVIRTPGLLMPVRSIARVPVLLHVSSIYRGLNGDGSAARPFSSLRAAFAAADVLARYGRDPTIRLGPWHMERIGSAAA